MLHNYWDSYKSSHNINDKRYVQRENIMNLYTKWTFLGSVYNLEKQLLSWKRLVDILL